ncbi:MAG: PAS domain-containing protein [Rhodoferax sp.]|nr:PAS domain-containing protein [Rhodoferax sp.]MCF8208601.1 PAS domain-containing protein [Rhodoferax sp.]
MPEEYCAICADITARKELEIEIKRYQAQLCQEVDDRTRDLAVRERQLKVIVDAIPGVVSYWDKHLVAQFANRVYKEWFGLSPSEIQGRHLRDVFGTVQYEVSQERIQAVMRGERQSFETLYPYEGNRNDMRFARCTTFRTRSKVVWWDSLSLRLTLTNCGAPRKLPTTPAAQKPMPCDISSLTTWCANAAC